ncbi:MAG: hypothetical protein NTX15_08945 [Candidatus Kapabacteria bacterium]|nr:hypothetical protein [Candidatus Kapabacteria bacterium]
MKMFALTLVCFAAVACTKLFSVDTVEIPKLKPRVSGLYEAEFVHQRKSYEKACAQIDATPDVLKPYSTVASVFMNEARVTGDHPYYYPAALNVIERGLHIDNQNSELLMQKTSVLLSLHRFEDARKLATTLCARMPNVATVFGMLCDANLELGKMNEAVAAATTMMNLRPSMESYARISYIRERHADMEGSLSAMHMAVQSGQPGTVDAAWARTTYGNLLFRAGRISDAERQFLLARLERKNFPFALAGLAHIERSRSNSTGAIALLDSALALMPEISFVKDEIDIERERGNTLRVSVLEKLHAQMTREDRESGSLAEAVAQ